MKSEKIHEKKGDPFTERKKRAAKRKNRGAGPPRPRQREGLLPRKEGF